MKCVISVSMVQDSMRFFLSEVDTSVYILGPCNKNGSCDCQRFKKKGSNGSDIEKCLYCDHFFYFHKSWVEHHSPVITNSYASTSNPAVLISEMPK